VATKPIEADWVPREQPEEPLLGRFSASAWTFMRVSEIEGPPGTPTGWSHPPRLFSPAGARATGMQAPFEEGVSDWQALRARQLEMGVRAYENAVRWQQRQNAELRGRVDRLEAQMAELMAEEREWRETERQLLQHMGVGSWREAEEQLTRPDGEMSVLDELFAEMTPEEWDEFAGGD